MSLGSDGTYSTHGESDASDESVLGSAPSSQSDFSLSVIDGADLSMTPSSLPSPPRTPRGPIGCSTPPHGHSPFGYPPANVDDPIFPLDLSFDSPASLAEMDANNEELFPADCFNQHIDPNADVGSSGSDDELQEMIVNVARNSGQQSGAAASSSGSEGSESSDNNSSSGEESNDGSSSSSGESVAGISGDPGAIPLTLVPGAGASAVIGSSGDDKSSSSEENSPDEGGGDESDDNM